MPPVETFPFALKLFGKSRQNRTHAAFRIRNGESAAQRDFFVERIAYMNADRFMFVAQQGEFFFVAAAAEVRNNGDERTVF